MGRTVELRGVLHIEVKSEVNRAKQHPLVIDFLGENGEIMFSAFGTRLSPDGRVLNSQSVIGGRVMTHSFFAPSLQEIIVNGHDDELADEQVDLIRERDKKIAYHMQRSKEIMNEQEP